MHSGDGEVTQLLKAWSKGDTDALERLAPLVEGELRRLARRYLSKEQPGETLQPTALVNEAYVRLIGWNPVEWQDRTHFYAVAAKMMRHILVNQAVSRGRQKRGGSALLVSLAEADQVSQRSADILALDEALIKLAKIDDRSSQLVELRFFAGLTADETAEVLGISARTVHREWDLARAWLFRELRGGREAHEQ
ncbi:MAG TPA: sigma-70 family RNA polymerase sigma factor [Bryobacteraceae bacterium]|jgi:RNA polymerase sigma factor (TIGR02999 family)|nr:sigma-70 family RNA polymerase sigma factor [Bryobacteraceae bacterium]